MPSRLSWQNWTWHICQIKKTEQNCSCCPHCRCHHLGYSVPPAHHCTIWWRSTFGPRGPGLSNPTSFLRPALPMAPTTDNNARDERSVLRPKPSDILKRFYALYGNKLRYYMKKVSILYCLFNTFWNIIRLNLLFLILIWIVFHRIHYSKKFYGWLYFDINRYLDTHLNAELLIRIHGNWKPMYIAVDNLQLSCIHAELWFISIPGFWAAILISLDFSLHCTLWTITQ